MAWLLGIVAFFLAGQSMPTTDLEAAKEAMEAQEWRRAVGMLTTHLKTTPDDTEAYYLRGICYGEIGKNPNLRNRLERSLHKGAADLDVVLSHDSLYQDAVYQLALIRRYEDNFREAIRLGERQVHLRPELSHAHMGLLNFYWRFVVTTPPTEARLWLREQPGIYTQLFIGKTYEQQSLFRPAINIYHALREEGAHPVTVRIALARLHFARQQHILGTQYMKEAIEAAETDFDALLLFDEIRTIVTPGEQAAFERLHSTEETQRFFADFWTRRDPMPAAPYNARLSEHYRRLREAETHYVFHGFRSWFRSRYTHEEKYFPPTYTLGHDFDDRGIMFIRHGEPDDFSIGESPTWLYESNAEQGDSLLVFHFAPTCHNGVCGITRHFVPVPRGESFLPPVLTGLDRVDAEQKTQAYITQGLSHDRHRWPSDMEQLDVPFFMASFRGLDGQTLVEAYYGVPTGDLITDEQDTLTFEAGFMVHDAQWHQHAFSRNTIRLATEEAGAPYRGLFQIDVRPQSFHVALHVRSLDMQALRAHKRTYVPLDFSGAGLKLSDILLADSVIDLQDGSAQIREDLLVQTRPSRVFSRAERPYVYFEIYDLALSPEERTHYAINYTLTNRRGETISLAPSEFEGRVRSPFEYVSLDISEIDAGRYELTVTVDDRVARRTVSRSQQLTVER